MMIQKNRPFRATLLAALLCGVSSVTLLAQGPGGPPPGGGPGGPHHGPPPSPLFDALDTNHDGVISAEEIANASTSLKALLKNGATQLSREDVRPGPPPPPPPPRHAPPGDEAAGDADHPQPGMHEMHPHHGPPPAADQAEGGPADKPAPAPEENAFRPGPQGDGPEHHGQHGPPPSPLFDALDTNHDGVISADEMSNAAGSLKAMLKKGSSELRREDLRPPHPPERP